jgi:hypothetical protein
VRKRAQPTLWSVKLTQSASLGARSLGEMLTESLQRQPGSTRSSNEHSSEGELWNRAKGHLHHFHLDPVVPGRVLERMFDEWSNHLMTP